MTPSKGSPYRLLVEGPDDKYSIINLMIRHGFNWDDESKPRPYVFATGGLPSLLEAVPVAFKGPYKRVGIVLDANSNLTARWAQVRAEAGKAEIELPTELRAEGFIASGHSPDSRIGIWFMPDNLNAGALENFLVELVPGGHAVWNYAEEVTREARQRGAQCQEKDHVKSALRTWLAWQAEPGLPFGRALETNILNADSATAQRFVAWFHRLFEP
jgi:hypothetical protein